MGGRAMTEVDAPSRGSVWPEMAVHSPLMTGRGARIRRERLRRRMSQMDLRDKTGVGLRTIGRIEAGEAENSPSLEVLESFLGLTDDQLPRADEPSADEPGGLESYSTTELLAEALRRVAHLEAMRGGDATSPLSRPAGLVRWASADAPSARHSAREEGGAQ
ncbi:MAG TPA: helix-turn-helix transcriptional regulator [Nonomuraea sp.]|nr:helix-turn-helix transcriptional regulator [Nonomuraea sp.]